MQVSPKLRWPTWLGVGVEDIETMTAFYRDKLGFRETEKGDGWVQFDLDGHLFEVIARSTQPQYDGRRYQVGYTVDDIESARK